MPPLPVRLYRDPLATGGNDGDAPSEGPRLAPPVGFTLVFRDSAHPPVTFWRPLPPPGYTEVRANHTSKCGWLIESDHAYHLPLVALSNLTVTRLLRLCAPSTCLLLSVHPPAPLFITHTSKPTHRVPRHSRLSTKP